MADMAAPESTPAPKGPEIAGTTPPAGRGVIGERFLGPKIPPVSTDRLIARMEQRERDFGTVRVSTEPSSQLTQVTARIGSMSGEDIARAAGEVDQEHEIIARAESERAEMQRRPLQAEAPAPSFGSWLRNKFTEAGNRFLPRKRATAGVPTNQDVRVKEAAPTSHLDNRVSKMSVKGAAAGGVAHPPRGGLLPPGVRRPLAAALGTALVVTAGVAAAIGISNDRNRIVAIPPPSSGPTGSPTPGETGSPAPSESATPAPSTTETPAPSDSPAPSASETPVVTPTPVESPTPVPTATPTAGTESPTPTEIPIEDVPLVGEGGMQLEQGGASIYGGTITYVDTTNPDELIFAITMGGDKISVEKNTPKYHGFTLWGRVNNLTRLYTPSMTLLGQGPESIRPLLKVGGSLNRFSFATVATPVNTPEEIEQNKITLEKIKDDTGKHFPRSDRRYSVTLSFVEVDK